MVAFLPNYWCQAHLRAVDDAETDVGRMVELRLSQYGRMLTQATTAAAASTTPRVNATVSMMQLKKDARS